MLKRPRSVRSSPKNQSFLSKISAEILGRLHALPVGSLHAPVSRRRRVVSAGKSSVGIRGTLLTVMGACSRSSLISYVPSTRYLSRPSQTTHQSRSSIIAALATRTLPSSPGWARRRSLVPAAIWHKCGRRRSEGREALFVWG